MMKERIITEYISSILLLENKCDVPIGQLTKEHPFARIYNVSIFTDADVVVRSLEA